MTLTPAGDPRSAPAMREMVLKIGPAAKKSRPAIPSRLACATGCINSGIDLPVLGIKRKALP